MERRKRTEKKTWGEERGIKGRSKRRRAGLFQNYYNYQKLTTELLEGDGPSN
jgi:hypothetical protein